VSIATTSTEPGRSGNARPRRRSQTTTREERPRSPRFLAPPRTPRTPRVGPPPPPVYSPDTEELFDVVWPLRKGKVLEEYSGPRREASPQYVSSSPLPSPTKDTAAPATLLASASAQIISDIPSNG
jgi:hypothetical protein